MARLSIDFLLLGLLFVFTPRSVTALSDDDDGSGGGESLFDDDEVEAWKSSHETFKAGPKADNEIEFNSKTCGDKCVPKNIDFDERGNIKEDTWADLAFYRITAFNGDIIDEPTDGSEALKAAIEKGEDYEVRFSPPSVDRFQCTEKVDPIDTILEQYSHELPEEMLQAAAKTLEAEGVRNSKQLGELHDQDFEQIQLPALIKSRLRKLKAEAAKMSAVADHKVDLDGAEIQAELDRYAQARQAASNGEAAPAPAAADSAASAPAEEEDGTFKSLVWAVMNCPTCKGKETIDCFRNCRYGNAIEGVQGEKKSWSECLDVCLENRWLRATFRAILPSER